MTTDLTSTRFGLWVVQAPAARRQGRAYWSVACDCGTIREVEEASLRRGASTNCGCVRRDLLRTGAYSRRIHGMTNTPTWRSWKSMLERCHLATHTSFKDYGAKGINVCARWHEFESFLRDMGERPQGTTLDRYPDYTGHYEPGNCRWATIEQQNRNKGNVNTLTFGEKTMCVAEWAREVGLRYSTLVHRINQGWSTERALLTPVLARSSKGELRGAP